MKELIDLINEYIKPFELRDKSYVVQRLKELAVGYQETKSALDISRGQYGLYENGSLTQKSVEIILDKLPGIIYKIRERKRGNIINPRLIELIDRYVFPWEQMPVIVNEDFAIDQIELAFKEFELKIIILEDQLLELKKKNI